MGKSLGFDFLQSGIKLVNVKGSGKAKKIGQYLEYLKDSSTSAFVIADGDKELKKKVEDWEREQLLPKGNYVIWDKEFEDLFPPTLIAECCGELGYSGFSSELLIKETGGRSIVHTIKKLIYEKSMSDLDKPALAESIAIKVSKDPKSTPKPLSETVAKIFATVGFDSRKAYVTGLTRPEHTFDYLRSKLT